MSRHALALSVALHAGLLLLVGKWLSASAGPGDPGAGKAFSTAGAGSLVVAIEPQFLPPEPLPAPPDFTPTAPVPDPPAAPLALVTAPISPVPAPSALSPQSAPMKTTAASAKSGQRARPNGGVSSQPTGSGLAGGGSRMPGYVPPSFRLRYKPPYPEEARARRLEGTVLLLVSLDATGHVTAAALQRTCGHGILDRAALAAVRSWLFEPARQNGAAIAGQVEIPIRFRFEERTGTRA